MSLSDVISEDLSIFFSTDEFAETATYVPYDGDRVFVPVIVMIGEELEDDMLRVAVQSTATILVKASDVSAPTTRDQFEIGDDTWLVERILQKSHGVWRLSVAKDVRMLHRR